MTTPAEELDSGAGGSGPGPGSALDAKTPIVISVILALGFLLLLTALRAPLAALAATLTALLSTTAAFGVSRLIFQDGHGAGLLGFTPQGFFDGWAPVFFFAMIFAIAMDYTVFLLAAAKEHFELTDDPRSAVTGHRRSAPLRARRLRRDRGDGRGVLHLLAVRTAAAEGDGRHPPDRRSDVGAAYNKQR